MSKYRNVDGEFKNHLILIKNGEPTINFSIQKIVKGGKILFANQHFN